MELEIGFVSLFPEVIRPYLGASILHRASSNGLVAFSVVNPRDFTYDRHAKVDDAPFGGEPGLLIKAEPVALAVESLKMPAGVVISTDPAGAPFRQADAIELASQSSVVFLCGHYEGIDERVIDFLGARRYSIGDFVLTGGELPALVMADAICRNVPGVLGDAASLAADSFSEGGLSAENYTRPAVWRGIPVPDVLMSGNHAEIRKWRAARAQEITQQRRPDLLEPS